MSDTNAVLGADPLAQAESLTGKSHHDDSETLRLGLALSARYAEVARREMNYHKDTHNNSSLIDVLIVLAELGFDVIHEHTFIPFQQAHEPRQYKERFIALWREGVLVILTSSRDQHGVNSLTVYFNWRRNKGQLLPDIALSGHFYAEDRSVWVGTWQGLSGLRHRLSVLESAGKFLDPWVERPFLYLNDPEQTNAGADHHEIGERLLASLPVEVQQSVAL